ncbi:MAG: hypothetical protein JOZ82_11260, partial [Marmoricola sp.]|nr:hypothetical protein [Marmoricola sp.]
MVRAADAAEARGDAQAVLNLIEQDVRSRGDFTFWRPWRLDRLVQVVAIGSDLPGWAVSRWLLAQASHQLDGSARDRTSEALEIALESRGGLRTVDGTDELDAKCKVMDHDWVFRQVLLYELGGAESFVDRVASPELVERSDRFDHWLGTAMGGYRLVRESPRESIWADLGNGHEVASINLGSSCLRRTGECVIGRVVPAGSGSMFEALPLPVPEDVADRVARKPDEWLSAIAPHRWIHRDWHEYGLLTDVPIGVQLLVAASCTGAIGQDMGTAEEA